MIRAWKIWNFLIYHDKCFWYTSINERSVEGERGWLIWYALLKHETWIIKHYPFLKLLTPWNVLRHERKKRIPKLLMERKVSTTFKKLTTRFGNFLNLRCIFCSTIIFHFFVFLFQLFNSIFPWQLEAQKASIYISVNLNAGFQ